jgi:hypothetical protein
MLERRGETRVQRERPGVCLGGAQMRIGSADERTPMVEVVSQLGPGLRIVRGHLNEPLGCGEAVAPLPGSWPATAEKYLQQRLVHRGQLVAILPGEDAPWSFIRLAEPEPSARETQPSKRKSRVLLQSEPELVGGPPELAPSDKPLTLQIRAKRRKRRARQIGEALLALTGLER